MQNFFEEHDENLNKIIDSHTQIIKNLEALINKHKAERIESPSGEMAMKQQQQVVQCTITRKYSSITYNAKKTVERRICFNIPENQWIRGKTTKTRGPYGKTTNRKNT